MKYIYIVLCICIATTMFAQEDSLSCYSTRLTYKETALKMGNHFMPNQHSWFEIELKDYYESPAIRLKKISLQDSSFIEVYDEISCDSLGSALLSEGITSSETELDLSSLTPGEAYFVLVRSPELRGGLFEIAYLGNYALDGCHYEVNRDNNTRQAQKVPLSTYNVQRCWSSCNRYVRSNLRSNHRKEPFLTNIKWYHIDSELSPAFINVSGFSSEDDFEVFVAHKSNNGALRILHRQQSETRNLSMEYLPTHGAKDYYIGIRSLLEPYCNYQLCISYLPYENHNSCIDYQSEGDTLFPVSTSLGSDLEGPYIAGEEVVFKYRINQWRPINHNWLQAVIPKASGPWSLKKDTVAIDSLTEWGVSFEGAYDTSEFWNWVYEDSVQHFASLNSRFKGPGWYASFDGTGPAGIAPKTRWGKSVDYHKVQRTPYFEAEFVMVVDDTLDCDSLYITALEARAYSDHEAGQYIQKGCSNTAEVFQCTVKCCDIIPEAAILDTLICDEEVLRLKIDHLFEPAQLVSPDLNWDREVENGTMVYKISTGLREPASYDLWLITDDKRYCEDTLPLSFSVVPKPDIDLGDDLIICPGDPVHLHNKKGNGRQILNHEWQVVGTPLEEDDRYGEELLLTSVMDPTGVQLTVVNEFGCYNVDTALIDVVQFESFSFIDVELCPEDVDSVLNLAHIVHDDRCAVAVQLPSGAKVNQSSVTLSEFGEYIVEVKCQEGCKQYYSFNVVPFQPIDTVTLTVCGSDHAFVPIEMGLSDRLHTRSLDENYIDCSDYKKDTVYTFKYVSGCLDEVDQSLDVFPNPSSETIHLVNRQNIDKKYLIITSAGVVVRTGDLPAELMVTVGGLDPGIYRILVYSDSGGYSIYKQIISR